MLLRMKNLQRFGEIWALAMIEFLFLAKKTIGGVLQERKVLVALIVKYFFTREWARKYVKLRKR